MRTEGTKVYWLRMADYPLQNKNSVVFAVSVVDSTAETAETAESTGSAELLGYDEMPEYGFSVGVWEWSLGCH